MTVKLKDICSKIGSGATPKGGSTVYIDSGISFIRSQNVYNLNFNYDGLTYITDSAAKKLSGVTVENEDVLINITGDSVARTCIVPNNVIPARVNQHVAIIRPDRNILRPRYLNYYLASPYMQAYMLGLAVGKGASRNAMTKEMIGNFDIPCPSIENQDRIVEILSAYDNLIENNQKQIKLLEEAAQRLYKEWFVDLRFPGYENTKFVDGVPEGWKKGRLEDISKFKRGKTITKAETINGVVPVVAGGLEPACYHNKSNTSAPVVTVSGSGANAGFTRLYYEDVFASDCSYADINDTPYIFFVYCFLKNNCAWVDSLKRGSAQPHVYANDINSLDLLVPEDKVLEDFSDVVKHYFSIIKNYGQKQKLLAEARDRLLPKLMSGELEV